VALCTTDLLLDREIPLPFNPPAVAACLPGDDGLPAYLYAHGRRYSTLQVCAGADWCRQARAQQAIPRCYTQADLHARQVWPLAQVASLFTLFGASHPILAPAGARDLTAPFLIADGTDCYVMYALEGGP
jgi:hypothetical protein